MKPKLSNMDKEELRKRMSKAIGTFENQMVRRISEDCAEIAMQYFTEQLNKHSVSGKRPFQCPNCQATLQEVEMTNREILDALAACASGAVDKTVSVDLRSLWRKVLIIAAALPLTYNRYMQAGLTDEINYNK